MVTILTAGPDDWSLVRDVRLRALADSPNAFGVPLHEAQAQPEALWRQRLDGPSPTLLAVEDGQGVGMGGGFLPPEPDVVWIWGMWVDPASRGTGLARRILADLLVWAWSTGRTAHLHVAEGNDSARSLYSSCGFVPTGAEEPLRPGSTVMIEEMAIRRG